MNGTFFRSARYIGSHSVITFTAILLFGHISYAQGPPAFTLASYRAATETTEAQSLIEHRVFGLINDVRTNNGKAALMWNDQAATAARSHSIDMAGSNYFSHEDLSGGRVSQRSASAGLKKWRQLGENISGLSGYADPALRVVDRWMHSSGHRENLLDERYQESGVGLAIDPRGKYYFTQVFVRR